MSIKVDDETLADALIDPLGVLQPRLPPVSLIRKHLGAHARTTSTTYGVTDGGKMHIELPSAFFEEIENGYYRPIIYATGFFHSVHANVGVRLRLAYIDETGAIVNIILETREPVEASAGQFMFHAITEYLRKYRHVFLHIDIRSQNGLEAGIEGHSWVGVLLDYGKTAKLPYQGWLR